jgi:hypothetical protein
MSVYPVLATVAAWFAACALLDPTRSLVTKEIGGRFWRHVISTVASAIQKLPAEIRDDWTEEWWAELDAMSSMPLTAFVYAHELKLTATRLASNDEGEDELPARHSTASLLLDLLRVFKQATRIVAMTSMAFVFAAAALLIVALSPFAISALASAVYVLATGKWPGEFLLVYLPVGLEVVLLLGLSGLAATAWIRARVRRRTSDIRRRRA